MARVEWELNGGSGGFGLRKPELTRDNQVVVDVWGFCGGWDPAALELAVTYYAVTDVDLLIELLLAMRDRIQAHHKQAGH